MQHITPEVKNEQLFHKQQENFLHSNLNRRIATLLSALTSNFSNQRINNSKYLILTFLDEITRRSKSSQHVVLSAAYLFECIYSVNLKNISMSKMPEFSRCSKRIFLCCLIIAHKFQNDSTFSIKTWSMISGLSARDLTSMERWTLSTLKYNVWTKPSVLKDWSRSVLFDQSAIHLDSCISKVSSKRQRDTEQLDDSLMHTAKKLHPAV